MAPKKKVAGLIKLQIQAGVANPAPPVGPGLASMGSSGDLCGSLGDLCGSIGSCDSVIDAAAFNAAVGDDEAADGRF